MNFDFAWTVVSFLLTLLVLSYLVIGDNALFRIATYAFIGIAAAYVILITFNQVIWPKFVLVLVSPGEPMLNKLLLGIPFVLGLLLMAKFFPRMAKIGNPAMAYLVGVGAAVIIGGAVLGTLFPQGAASANLFDTGAIQARGANLGTSILEAIIALAGTAATLLYFHFSTRSNRLGPQADRGKLIETGAQVGQVFLAITLGSLFAGVYIAALSALVERANFILHVLF